VIDPVMFARATSIGIEAHRALSVSSRGRVAAVFTNSCYIRFARGWACLGGSTLGRGPLNVPCTGAPHDWRGVIAPGSPVRVHSEALELCGHVIGLDAELWAPAPRPPSTCTSRAAGVAALSRALPSSLPDGGLAGLLRPQLGSRTPVETAAWPAVQALARWAALPEENEAEPPLHAVCTLLGLGPGLTPSGDDFLAGFLVALRAIGQSPRSTAMARMIDDHGSLLTSDLSTAHLHAAGVAGLSEALEYLLVAILAGERAAIEAKLIGLSASPHHSPWDALAGMVAVLRGVAQAQSSGIRAAVSGPA
jgi:hypothetical protein